MEARRILSYYEHLTEEQRPPKSIFHSRKKCQRWIDDHGPGKSGTGGGGPLTFSEREVERA